MYNLRCQQAATVGVVYVGSTHLANIESTPSGFVVRSTDLGDIFRYRSLIHSSSCRFLVGVAARLSTLTGPSDSLLQTIPLI